MKRTPLTVLLTTAAAATAVLTACSSTGTGTKAASSAPPAGSSSAPSSAAAGGGQATGQSITANLSEFKIALSSSTLKAGTYTVHVKNVGQITHALTFDGPGVSGKSTGDMSPGSARTLTVTLKAGKYDVFCPVGNHKMEGMDDTVTVQ